MNRDFDIEYLIYRYRSTGNQLRYRSTSIYKPDIELEGLTFDDIEGFLSTSISTRKRLVPSLRFRSMCIRYQSNLRYRRLQVRYRRNPSSISGVTGWQGSNFQTRMSLPQCPGQCRRAALQRRAAYKGAAGEKTSNKYIRYYPAMRLSRTGPRPSRWQTAACSASHWRQALPGWPGPMTCRD